MKPPKDDIDWSLRLRVWWDCLLSASGSVSHVNLERRCRSIVGLCALLMASCSSAGTEPASDAATGGSSEVGIGGSGTGSGGVGPTLSDGSLEDASAGGAADTSGGQPYAHVVAVSVSGAAGQYTFSVSVESADIDCSQFADWWEVLSEDGMLLYRRILQHSHTDENGTSDQNAPGNTFTREGGPVAIAEGQEVVVRAHMNSAGYNGTALRGSVAGGFAAAPDVGPDFAAAVETEEPQPEQCMF
jgi:hypothetical protein